MVGVGNHEYDHSSGGAGRDPSGMKTEGGWRPDWSNAWDDSGGECGVPTYHRFVFKKFMRYGTQFQIALWNIDDINTVLFII